MSKEKEMFGLATPTLTASSDVKIISNERNNVCNVIFKGLQVSLNQESYPLNQVLVFSLEIPIKTEKTILGYIQDITFGVERSKGTRVSMVFDLGSALHTIEYPFEANFTQEPPEPAPLIVRRFFSPQGIESANQDIFGLLGVKSYLATIYISVQRKSCKDTAIVSVDGIDIVAVLI